MAKNKKLKVGDPARMLGADESAFCVMQFQVPKRAVMIPLALYIAVLDDGSACICVHPEVDLIRAQADPVGQTREMFEQLKSKLDELCETVVLQIMPTQGGEVAH